MKLNIGSGYKRIPGFLNVDHDELVKPDFLVDLENLKLTIDDNMVEYIVAHHIFEHIGEGFYSMMKELYRVCKNNAHIDIIVPHHKSEMYYCDPTHRRFVTVDMMKLFSKDYNRWHIEQYNSSSGFGLKLDVDFVVKDYRFIPYEKWKTRFENMSQDEIQEVVDNLNNVFVETHILLEVIK